MWDSLSPLPLLAGAVAEEHEEAANKDIQVLHTFAETISRALLSHMASCQSMSASSCLYLDGMVRCLNNFAYTLQRTNLGLFSIWLSCRRLMYYHWRLIGIPMISQQVKYSDEETVTVANCPLCNHPYRNLDEIIEIWKDERALFATAIRKHQTEADWVIGGKELWQLSQCCGIPPGLRLCMCVWGVLP